MSLPTLPDWTSTRVALHQAAQVIGAVRAAVMPPEPNYLHLGLRIVPQGVTTGDLPGVGELTLDFPTLSILYSAPDEETAAFSLVSHTQRTLADALEDSLLTMGHPVEFSREKLAGSEPFHGDPAAAARYAEILARVAGVLERLRAGLPGEKTPLVVWPHGFDAAFLWFASPEASEQAPHLSFGFSPASAGLGRPYLYSYAYPVPAGLLDAALPPPAHWHTQGWTGAVIPYDALRGLDNPEEALEQALRAVYEAAAPLLKH